MANLKARQNRNEPPPHRKAGIWWARQDSNLQPDGYEPPALTIELRAPQLLTLRRPSRLTT